MIAAGIALMVGLLGGLYLGCHLGVAMEREAREMKRQARWEES